MPIGHRGGEINAEFDAPEISGPFKNSFCMSQTNSNQIILQSHDLKKKKKKR